MKKLFAVLLAVLMVLTLAGCGSNNTATDAGTTDTTATQTIYVMGPTPDHGWTAQAGTYAEAKAKEINAAGTYKSEYLSASSGEEQNDQIKQIIANGDAAGVVMMALDDTAASGQEELAANNIPFISFDRIIEATEKYAILNYSGDNWQCGAGIAYWLQKNGLKPGDTCVILYGDNGTVCTRREEGFRQFLKGEIKYQDNKTGEYETAETWTDEQLDALFGQYSTVCNWSKDGASSYLEQKISDIIADAKGNNGKLYIYSMDDEMTFGVLNVLEGLTGTDAADAEALELYISAIGGMQEFYDVMSGADTTLAPLADKYFDDTMSMFFSPKMMQTAVNYMVDYLAGNWSFNTGDGTYEPVFIVDRTTAGQTEGFTGH